MLLLVIMISMVCSVYFGNANNINIKNSNSPSASGSMETPLDAIDEIPLGTTGGEFDVSDRGILSGEDYDIFWWIHISDTQFVWWNYYSDANGPRWSRIQDAEYFFNTTAKVINPVCIINSGDLVDSDYVSYMSINSGQNQEEWELYNTTISNSVWNHTNYFYIVGNHDIYYDEGFTYYLNYSIAGSYTNTDQYHVNLELPFGNYSFYLLSTTEDYGLAFPFGLGGHMSNNELEWFENKLMAHDDANVSFVFGHQPPFEVFSSRSPSGNTMIELMDEHGVDFYGTGHGHDNNYQKINGMAAVETTKLHADKVSYRIVAVDNDGISSSVQSGLQEFPVGIITNPIDEHYAIGDFDIKSEQHQNPDKIRTLAFDPDGIASVVWRHDGMEDGVWKTMIHVESALYEADWEDITGTIATVQVKITNINGLSKVEEIVYNKEIISFFGWQQGRYFIAATIFGLVVALPIGLQVFRRRNLEKLKKNPKTKVDTKQAKLLMAKLITYLIMPMAIIPILSGTPVVMFSLFLVGSPGIIYCDITILFFGLTSLFTIIPHAFRLSKKWSWLLILGMFPSLLFEGLLITIYFSRYGIWGLLSIGWFILVALDIMMIIRASHLHKSRNL